MLGRYLTLGFQSMNCNHMTHMTGQKVEDSEEKLAQDWKKVKQAS